jgi:hypothetical protein
MLEKGLVQIYRGTVLEGTIVETRGGKVNLVLALMGGDDV